MISANFINILKQVITFKKKKKTLKTKSYQTQTFEWYSPKVMDYSVISQSIIVLFGYAL